MKRKDCICAALKQRSGKQNMTAVIISHASQQESPASTRSTEDLVRHDCKKLHYKVLKAGI